MRFDNKSRKLTINSNEKPLLYITKIIFTTGDVNWVSRLTSASLTIKFTCIDEKGNERKASEEQFVFGGLISPYHTQPVIEVNRLFCLDDVLTLTKDSECTSWRTMLELSNLSIDEGEYLEIFTINPSHLSGIDQIISEIERLKNKFGTLSSSTSDLLRLVPYFRLDWSQGHEEFSQEFDMGATKPVLLSGLANPLHKIHNSNALLKNSKLAQLLVHTFLIEKNLTTELLRDIHKQVIKGGGNFRTENVVVTDRIKSLSPPFSSPSKIQSNLEALVGWYNIETTKNQVHPLILATVFHYNFVTIHPFLDGNGRLGRVIASLILLSFHIPPPIARNEDRSEYLNALRNADGGDMKPLLLFIGNRIIQSMNSALILKHNSHG